MALKINAPTVRQAPQAHRVIAARWYGLGPAIIVLGVCAAAWGVTALADGYREQMGRQLDTQYPLIAALKEGTNLAAAESIAGAIAKRPEFRSVQAVGANALIEGALPEDREWTEEIEKIDAQLIPPSLIMVVDEGVKNRQRRATAMDWARELADERIDYFWQDGADLDAARSRLEIFERMVTRGRYGVLFILVGAWMVFLLIDMRHFVFLVGRDQTTDFIGENMVLRQQAASLLRGAIVAIAGGVVGCVILTTLLLILGAMPPAWAVRQALIHTTAFAVVAGVGGHSIMGALLWRHAAPARKVSIQI